MTPPLLMPLVRDSGILAPLAVLRNRYYRLPPHFNPRQIRHNFKSLIRKNCVNALKTFFACSCGFSRPLSEKGRRFKAVAKGQRP